MTNEKAVPMDQVKALMGLQLHGRFQGVDTSQQLPALLVDFDYRDGGGSLQTVTRRCTYAGYSSATGEITEIGEQVLKLVEGQQIAVSVWVNPQGRTLLYRAQAVVVVDDAVPANGHGDFDADRQFA